MIQGAAKIEDIDTVVRFSALFVLRLEFHARANSGSYLRGKQLQVRDYATVGPYTQLKNYKKGDWNAIEVIVTTDPASRVSKARCTCNGELLEAELEIPAEGPIGLQSETNRLEYRNIRIKVAAASAAPVPTAP
ncbi:MAG: family 16 glycoside hydrolase [Isosphaeraceae bacterium]